MNDADALILTLIGRGESRDDLHETLRIGHRCGLPGYFDCGTPGDLEQRLRDMAKRGLVEWDGDLWRQMPQRAAASPQKGLFNG